MKIAILGLGTVGFGVYDIIDKSSYCADISVKYILDKDSSRQGLAPKAKVVQDLTIITSDPEVSVVVETMGAGEFSHKCMVSCLEANKSVITANKEVVALYLEELTNLKVAHGVSLSFEPSVGGGIPLIAPLEEIVKTNTVSEINGIINGTTNFMLTRMVNDGMDFASSLALAQKKGFAEANPTADLEGLDMVRKIIILSMIAYKGKLPVDKVYHYGISTLSDADIAYITSLGDKSLKLMASSERQGAAVALTVEPTLVSKGSLFAGVNDEFNLIEINCDINGDLAFYGKGAGRYPTANAIVNDLIDIKEGKKNPTFKAEATLVVTTSLKKSAYYVRLKTDGATSLPIARRDGVHLITKEMDRGEFLKELPTIAFYAKIKA